MLFIEAVDVAKAKRPRSGGVPLPCELIAWPTFTVQPFASGIQSYSGARTGANAGTRRQQRRLHVKANFKVMEEWIFCMSPHKEMAARAPRRLVFSCSLQLD